MAIVVTTVVEKDGTAALQVEQEPGSGLWLACALCGHLGWHRLVRLTKLDEFYECPNPECHHWTSFRVR